MLQLYFQGLRWFTCEWKVQVIIVHLLTLRSINASVLDSGSQIGRKEAVHCKRTVPDVET